MILTGQGWDSFLEVEVCEIDVRLTTGDGSAIPREPWWANELRSALGSALRQVMCPTPLRKCESCRQRRECKFLGVWQPTRGDETRGPEHRTPPWVIECSQEPESLDITVRLFGSAVLDAWQWRVALELAAARGLGRAKKRYRAIAQPRQTPPRRLSELCQVREPGWGALRIDLTSPLRLVHGGVAITAAPPFSLLVGAIERRARLAVLSWLGRSAEPITAANRSLARSVEIVADETRRVLLRRYSSRQEQAMSLTALEGRIEYSPGWEVFWPLLRLAPPLHVGKGATLGFGRVSFAQAPQV